LLARALAPGAFFDQVELVMVGTGTPLRLRSGDPAVPAIHASAAHKDVDAWDKPRDKAAHDGEGQAATLTLAAVLNGSPASIGSEGSRDHSFQEPKYRVTFSTPASLRATRVLEARAPLKQ
jgi:hypothetical protein